MNNTMRWNGWGREDTSMAIPSSGMAYLQDKLGNSAGLPAVSLELAVENIPDSRISTEHPLLSTDKVERLRHARGQSLPDWLAKKSGDMGNYPDAVAFPESRGEVAEILQLAKAQNWHVIPYGGGTSVVGHINVPSSTRPVVTVSLVRMNRLIHLDETNLVATFGAGTSGPEVEAQLQAHGYTLGHFPQSFEYSTVGGWVVTRSSGQQSLRYGRIEQMFAGGLMESPEGTVTLRSLPASAAGSDFRQHVMGSEGRMGIVTDVDLRIHQLPESEHFGLAFFPSWQQGTDCIRELVQQGVPLSMLRLSNPVETETQMLLSVADSKLKWLRRLWRVFGVGDSPCMLLYGITGKKSQGKLSKRQLKQSCKKHRGWFAGSALARHWQDHRFRSPYLREALWEQGLVVDTLETAIGWSQLEAMMATIETALVDTSNSFGQPIHVFSHLSHCYRDGATIYTSYVFNTGKDYQETLQRWQCMKVAASQAIVNAGGTISHQHGVGKDHKAYLTSEKGALPMAAIDAGFAVLDPDKIMNPGVVCD